MKKKEGNNNNKDLKKNQINLLEKNVDFDENIYFNHYFSVFGRLDFENPINERTIPYIMSREFLYSYFEVRKNIKSASKETITQIKGRIKQFSGSTDTKFNMIFLDNIKSYSEIIGIEETKNILVPVLAKIVDEKTDVKIHFLKVLHLNFIDYLCSIGDEGINILRQNIIQIIQELYRDKNITSEALKKLLFKVLVKIAKSIIPKEKDKKDNYILDLIMSFGYESNVSKDFYLDHKIICIKLIAILTEDFGQDLAENYLLPQIWFFANDEEEIIKKEVLIALPNLCQELRYEIIGTKIFKLIKKLLSDKSSIIREGTIAALTKIIKIYKEKININKNSEKNNEHKKNDIKLAPGSVENFMGLIEKLILDKDKNVRDTIIEYVGELINPLDKEELPQKIFDFYKNYVNEFYYNKELISSNINNLNLINAKNKNEKKEEKGKKEEKEKDKKENVNYYFAYNFPAILYCFGKEVWPKLNSLFFKLCKEKDLKVRRSIIASFHEVSKIVGEKITEEELLPLYDNYLNSKSPLEKNFAIKNLPKILSGVNKEIKEKYFKYFDAVSIFQQNMSSKVRNFFFTNWRNKIDVIEGILCYYHLYDKEIIYKSILPQCINFCFDDVFKVRSVSCKIFATLILYLYNENYKKKELFELLELFALHKKYYQRICFAKMCKVLLENINLYNEKLKILLYILIVHDKSNNVRVALGKSLGKILKNDKFKCVKETSFHKLCRMLNNGKSTSIKNIFNALDIKNCYNVNEEELFNFNDINKAIGNKAKIFDKENTFIKKEFDFDINECQHKYYKREGVILQKKDNTNIKDIKEEYINKSGDDKIGDKDKIEEKKIKNEKIKDEKQKFEKKNEEKQEEKKKNDDIKIDKGQEIIEEIKEDKKEELKIGNKMEIQEDNKDEIIEDNKDEEKKEVVVKEDNKEEIKKDNKDEEKKAVKIEEGNNEKIKVDNKKGEKEELKLENKLEIQENKKAEIEKIKTTEEDTKISEENKEEETKETKIETENRNKEKKIIDENNTERNEKQQNEEKDEKKEENENSNLIISNNEENKNGNIEENKINENNKELQIDDDSKKESKNENKINEGKEESIKESVIDVETQNIDNKNKNENKIKEEDENNENKDEKNQIQEGKKKKRKNKKKK